MSVCFSENDLNGDEFQQPTELSSLTFNIFSSSEIKKISVAEINESKLTGNGSVYDPRLGVIKNNSICVTCGKDPHDCSGHFGHIEIPVPIPHPMYVKEIVFYLNLFCSESVDDSKKENKCSRMCMTDEQIKLENYHKMKGLKKLNAISAYVSKLSYCQHCNFQKYTYYNEDKSYYRCTKKDKSDRELVSFEDIETILSNIHETDLKKLGLISESRNIIPGDFIIRRLLVLPTCARPYVETNRGSCDDDLTTRYIDIIKLCNILSSGVKKTKNISEKEKKEIVKVLYDKIDTMMYNHKKKAKTINGRPIKCIGERLNGKSGLFRQNLSAKRGIFCARTVVDGDPTTRADEIYIPPEFATRLTFPEKVFSNNLQHLQEIVNSGSANYVERTENGKTLRFNLSKSLYSKKTCEIGGFEMLEGDVIIREKDGDKKKITISKDFLAKFKAKFGKDFSLIPNDKVMRNKKLLSGEDIRPPEKIEFNLEPTDVVFRDGKRINHYAMKMAGKEFNLLETDKIYRKGQLIKNLCLSNRREFTLKIGDVVLRHLRDGDMVLFGRQPTLHKGSMIARYIRIQKNSSGVNGGRETRVIRMNLAQCKSYNADFDGDEMNIYLPQSYQSLIELKDIMSTKALIKTTQSAALFVNITQDALTAGYKLTCGKKPVQTTEINLDRYIRIDEPTFNDSIIQVEEWFENNNYVLNGNGKYGKTPFNVSRKRSDPTKLWKYSKNIWEKLEHIRNVLRWSGWEEKDISVFMFTGHSLFSLLLPDDFEYSFQSIFITRGVMIRGVLNKASLGGSHTSIPHKIEKEYGADAVIDFVSWYQWLFCDVLINYGFSIGMDDCKPIKQQEISDVISKSFIEAQSSYFSERDEIMRERKVNMSLNSAINVGQTITKNSVEFNNSLNVMILAGSKGSYVNAANIRSLVGQQNLGGQRLPNQYKGRSLPCYPVGLEDMLNDDSKYNPVEEEFIRKNIYESRGFISNCYMNGLNPREFYLHAVAAREGVCDTAIKTASSGYIQRKLVKKLEDLVVSYQKGIVVNSKNMVVQFDYGDDMDPARSVRKTDGNYSFVNVENLVNKLNQDVEYNMWKEMEKQKHLKETEKETEKEVKKEKKKKETEKEVKKEKKKKESKEKETEKEVKKEKKEKKKKETEKEDIIDKLQKGMKKLKLK